MRAFIASQHARFYPADPREISTREGDTIPIHERILNAAGYWKENNGELVHLVNLDTFRNEVCRGFNHLAVAKELDRRKLLLVNERRRFTYGPANDETFTHPSGVTGNRPRFFAIKAEIVDCDPCEQ